MITDSGREAELSRFCHDYVAAGMPGFVYLFRHPGRSLSAFAAISRMPCLRAGLSDGVEGAAIRVELSRGSVVRRTIFPLMAVLRLPPDPGQYELGASKQTLRRKIRRAQRLGVGWARVAEPEERQKLLQLAAEWERIHPDKYPRTPQIDHGCLLGYELWLAAYSAEGRPLLLSVTPVDGEWALLHYFRTLTTGEEASNARYLMTQVLVKDLIRLGARYLIDPASPLGLTNGLRHYQRMLGFRLVRFHLLPRRPSWPAERP
jgi:hypothetical protein